MSKFNYKIGDLVEIKCSDCNYIGRVMQSRDRDILVVKLDNGYNVGIDIKKVKDVKVKEKFKEKKEKKVAKIKDKKGLKTISILHTGGTVASKVSYDTGAVSTRFSPEELIGLFPELKDIANIKSRLIANMWSQDFRFSHYNLLAKEIEKEIKSGVDGVIITHGTDTLAVTSAALSFILEDINIPVLMVGSQRSSDRGSSDAGMNLICAAKFIKDSDFVGSAVCMHGSTNDDYCSILPACKTRKLHTSRRDAFKAVNDCVIAKVNYRKDRIEFLQEHAKKDDNRKLKLNLINEKLKVGILRSHVNMFAEQFSFFENYDGLIIEATGMGHLPTTEMDAMTKESGKIFKAIKNLVKKGVVVVITAQTIFGRINLNVYSNQREMKEAGVLDGGDMLSDTAMVKLAWLLSNNKDKDEVKKLMQEDLRGEINKRILMGM